MRVLLVSALVALGLVVSGCGGSLSVHDYRSQLAELCKANDTFNHSLPHRQQADHLNDQQLRRLAQDTNGEFTKKVAALDPPAALAGQAKALVTLLGQGVNHPAEGRAATVTYLTSLRKAYSSVGETGCANSAQQSIDALGG